MSTNRGRMLIIAIILLTTIVAGIASVRYFLFDSYEKLSQFPAAVEDRMAETRFDHIAKAGKSIRESYEFSGPDVKHGKNLDAPYCISREAKSFCSEYRLFIHDVTENYLLIVTGPVMLDRSWKFFLLMGNDTRVFVLDRETLEPIQTFRFFGEILTAVLHEGSLYMRINETPAKVAFESTSNLESEDEKGGD